MTDPRSGMEFEAYLTKYLRHVRHNGGGANTLLKYEEILRRANRDLPFGVLRSTTDELADFIWIDGRKPKTLAAYRSILAGFYTWAVSERHLGAHRLTFDPALDLPRVKIPRGTARPAEAAQLRDVIARAPEPVRTWYKIIAGTGLRCFDLSNLDREDCTARALFVTGKGGVVREVAMPPKVWELIEPMPPGAVARDRLGRRASPRHIMSRGNYYLHKFGYKITMHKIRGYHLTEFHETNGGDLLATQAQAGHADPSTTRLYVPVNRDKAQRAVAAIDLPF